MNLGWECPKCGGCYSPSVCTCSVCVPGTLVSSTHTSRNFPTEPIGGLDEFIIESGLMDAIAETNRPEDDVGETDRQSGDDSK